MKTVFRDSGIILIMLCVFMALVPRSTMTAPPYGVYIHSISEEGEIGPKKTVNVSVVVYNYKNKNYHDLTVYLYSADPVVVLPVAFVFDIGPYEFREFNFSVYLNTTATEFNFDLLAYIWENKMYDFEEFRLTYNDDITNTGFYNISVYNEVVLNYTVETNVNVTVENYNEILNEIYFNHTTQIDVYEEIVADLEFTVNNYENITHELNITNQNLFEMVTNLSIYVEGTNTVCDCQGSFNVTMDYPEGPTGMLKSGAYLLTAGFGLALVGYGYVIEQKKPKDERPRKPAKKIERLKIQWASFDGPIKMGAAFIAAPIIQLVFANYLFSYLVSSDGFQISYGNEIFGLLVAGIFVTLIAGLHNWKILPFPILLMGLLLMLLLMNVLLLYASIFSAIVLIAMVLFVQVTRKNNEYHKVDVELIV